MLPRKLLVVLLSAVFISAAAYAQVKTPVNPDEPITMTKGMYADLLCLSASEGGTQFTYDPTTDTVRIVHLDFVPPGEPSKYAANNAAVRKAAAKRKADFKLNLLLSQIRSHVSPATISTFSGF